MWCALSTCSSVLCLGPVYPNITFNYEPRLAPVIVFVSALLTDSGTDILDKIHIAWQEKVVYRSSITHATDWHLHYNLAVELVPN